MPFSWKETRICPRCRKTITRICKKIGHDYQQYSVARKSIIDWCRCNCEPIKNESIVYAKPLILEEEDLFTLFVDPQELDNAIFQYEEGFISQIEEKDLSPTWIDEDAVVGVS